MGEGLKIGGGGWHMYPYGQFMLINGKTITILQSNYPPTKINVLMLKSATWINYKIFMYIKFKSKYFELWLCIMTLDTTEVNYGINVEKTEQHKVANVDINSLSIVEPD